MKRNIIAIWTMILVAVVAGGYWFMSGRHHGGDVHDGASAATITIPELSAEAIRGKAFFSENCSACHGPNATGTDQGPPLVHIIYEPSHHGDPSFYLAVANGVRQHHWRFGNMPKVEGVGENEIEKIVAYVRELQRANGIE